MAPSSAKPHSDSSTIDLENGDRIERSISPRALNQDSSPSATPDRRRSGGSEAVRPRDRWRDSPRWTRIRDKVPPHVARCTRKVVQWVKGPQPPREYRIVPFFEKVQTYPIRLVARLPRLARICLYICAFMLWIVVFGVILSKYSLPKDIGGFGSPVKLSCIAQLWFVATLPCYGPVY